MQNKFNYKINEILKYDELKNKYFKRSERIVIYYGDKSHARYKMYRDVAHDNENVPFLYTNSPNIQWKLKIKKNNFVIVGNEGIVITYDSLWKKDKINYWVYIRTKP